MVGLLDDQSEWAGPEDVGEPFEVRWNCFGKRPRHCHTDDVNDERVRVWSLFGREDFSHRRALQSMGAKPVHGFRRKGDQPATSQNIRGARDYVRSRYCSVNVGQIFRLLVHGYTVWVCAMMCVLTRVGNMKNTAILLIDCPDRKGIVAAVADFLYHHNANILHADQHQDAERQLFLMRVEWDLSDFGLRIADFGNAFRPIADKFQMRWRLELSAERAQVGIFVSRYDHCLADLLYRHESGELACDIPCIISNHPDAARLAEFHRIAFHPITVDLDKSEAEGQQLALLRKCGVDLVVLARYMQILSPEFVAQFPHRIINVHHSFLPAFSGG